MHMSVYVCACLCAHVHVCMFARVHVYTCVHVRVCTWERLCMYVHVHVRVRVRMCITVRIINMILYWLWNVMRYMHISMYFINLSVNEIYRISSINTVFLISTPI